MKVTEQQMRILQNDEFQATSDKYKPIKTIDVINRFKEHGLSVLKVEESRTRLEHKQDKVRHFVTMLIDEVGGIQRTVVIMNSSDSTTSLRLHAGLVRMVCNNGLVLCDDIIPAEKIKHTSLTPFVRIDNFITMLRTKLDEEQALRELMMKRHLTALQMEQFVHSAVALREDDMSKVLDPMSANIIRRPEDAGKTIWNIFITSCLKLIILKNSHLLFCYFHLISFK